MKETILGVDVTDKNYKEISESIIYDINAGKQSFIVAVNPEKVLKAQKDEKLRQLLNQATYQIPDGIGIILASKIKKGNIRERVTGIDLLFKISQMAEQHQKSIFLYGAKPEVNELAKQNLLKYYPNLNIVGTMHGYEKDEQLIIDKINESKADILFVGLGSPRQENWIIENMKKLDVSIFQGVGGSYDVLSGKINRAPAIFRKFGLEWLYRLLVEPNRIKRQIKLPIFLIKVLMSKNES
ncbi:N-acetylglucosaminyldiphosphoundecaprenol N-acetyl-beta-D-mannosaminyltransferase [Thalassobacillus cyri]|uniref:N-acetylglucosaminyldiphosphoundecaprenol N-acetyl-beta-D-mannosaminyltransferase n=1 Tax=Thalassobacillus cyri TaxID=571932 RepID=A0A1H4DVV1_9BACI|nr:WecB/TagA/CpsF family glycosyltransferase [Thalassobacillus cyri]SEA76727.1 N-acetylglucosaminyldiphosphoundecaprenol N-acetyl-beta-D-mannosaminyltransferase [Thalassobacillus cyri]